MTTQPVVIKKTTVVRPFVPPTFAKFGKNTKDLFKKKYDFTHTLKSVRQVGKSPVTFEHGFSQSNSGVINGYIKSKYIAGSYEVEGEASTDASADTKVQFRFPKVYPGVNLTATANVRPDEKAFSGSVASGEVEYSTSNISSTIDVKSDGTTHRVKASAAIGMDGVSVGGLVAIDGSKGVDVIDYNVGVEYSGNGYTATLLTENQLDYATLSYHQRIATYHSVGAQFRVKIAGPNTSTLTVGNEYAIDSVNTVKTKIEVPSGIVSASIEHRLSNPSILFNIAAVFNPLNFANKGVSADKFGLGLTIGDY